MSRAREWLRPRRLVLGLCLLILALLIVTACAAFWLMRTGSGRDFVLNQAAAALPPGALSWETAAGTLAGGLELGGLRYATDAANVNVAQLDVRVGLMPLLQRRLEVAYLRADGVDLLLPEAVEPEPGPPQIELPDSLPSLDLPLTVHVHELRVDNARIMRSNANPDEPSTELLEVDQLDSRFELVDGRLALQRFMLRSSLVDADLTGDLGTAPGMFNSLDGSVVLKPAGAEPIAVDVRSSGPLDDFQLELRANLPEPAVAVLQLDGGLPDPQIRLQLDAPRIDPAQLGLEPGEDIAISLDLDGDLQRVALEGFVALGEQRVEIQPSVIAYADGVLQLQPLRLVQAGGDIDVQGSADFNAERGRFDLQVSMRDWPLPAGANATAADAAASEEAQAPVFISGNASVVGPLADYALQAQLRARRGDDTAELQLAGRGSDSRLQLESLTGSTPGGGLEGAATVEWSPQLSWQAQLRLEDFDPGFFVPDLPGSISARLTTDGTRDEGGLQMNAKLEDIDGQLRDRALAGSASVQLGAAGDGELALQLRVGDSAVRADGRFGPEPGSPLDIDLQLDPLRLSDFLTDAAGVLQGDLQVSGSRADPRIAAALTGSGIGYAGIEAESLVLGADVSRARGADQRIDLDATGVQLAGQQFGAVRIDLRGPLSAHELAVALEGEQVDLDLQASGSANLDAGSWDGRLDNLRIALPERGNWELGAPAAIAYGAERTVVDDFCLASASAELCADLDWPRQGTADASFQLRELPLSLLADLAGMEPIWQVEGTLSGEGGFARTAAGGVSGSARLAAAHGGISLPDPQPRELLVFDDLVLNVALDEAVLRADIAAVLADNGRLSGDFRLDDPLGEDGALDGRVELDLRQLQWMELLTDELIVQPQGALSATVQIGGSRLQPRIEANATVSGFAAEVPAAGLALTEGEVRIRSAGASAADITGSLRSGEGRLSLDGSLDFSEGSSELLTLELRGKDFTAARIPEAEVRVSPELDVSMTARENAPPLLRVRGRVDVPYARINLENIEGSVRPSSDVVIVDPAEGDEAGEGMEINADVRIGLGEDVELAGFGLDGEISGELRVRERAGRATSASGSLNVTGRYEAYGQDLEITRGRLAYAETPIDNPALDISAQREVDAVTVGIRVVGTARRPQLTVWSDPSMDQAEALSYLVLGRPLRSASSAEGQELNAAAVALGAGGNMLAERLGARLGFDAAEVGESDALGGTALTVGKYLSPKLFVSYGIGLFGEGQVLSLKYILSRVWDIQVDTSALENRASLNYRLER